MFPWRSDRKAQREGGDCGVKVSSLYQVKSSWERQESGVCTKKGAEMRDQALLGREREETHSMYLLLVKPSCLFWTPLPSLGCLAYLSIDSQLIWASLTWLLFLATKQTVTTVSRYFLHTIIITVITIKGPYSAYPEQMVFLSIFISPPLSLASVPSTWSTLNKSLMKEWRNIHLL